MQLQKANGQFSGGPQRKKSNGTKHARNKSTGGEQKKTTKKELHLGSLQTLLASETQMTSYTVLDFKEFL